jgi:hypothetical protein
VRDQENHLNLASNSQLSLGNMNMVSVKTGCKGNSCGKSVVGVLGGQDLCLDHFIARCYERLDILEPKVRSRSLEEPERRAVRSFLEECLNGALRVSLRHENLTNLDRSRLLNILLLSGDLHLTLQLPLIKHKDSNSDVSPAFSAKTFPHK